MELDRHLGPHVSAFVRFKERARSHFSTASASIGSWFSDCGWQVRLDEEGGDRDIGLAFETASGLLAASLLAGFTSISGPIPFVHGGIFAVRQTK
jgi:hypothetical protein